jgi:hypothetical protein
MLLLMSDNLSKLFLELQKGAKKFRGDGNCVDVVVGDEGLKTWEETHALEWKFKDMGHSPLSPLPFSDWRKLLMSAKGNWVVNKVPMKYIFIKGIYFMSLLQDAIEKRLDCGLGKHVGDYFRGLKNRVEEEEEEDALQRNERLELADFENEFGEGDFFT